MSDIIVINNKWTEKAWKDPMKHRLSDGKKVKDSTPLVSKSTPQSLDITYVRANRIKTLRGIRR